MCNVTPVKAAFEVSLNQRILSTMDRRTVAAHPWHDLEIGEFIKYQPALHSMSAMDVIVLTQELARSFY